MYILIVEDDDKVAGFVADGFRREGHVSLRARDGEEGLAAARSGRFDAAVMDVMIPGLDGIEVIRRLRAAGRRLPIIILSARGSVESKVCGLEAGADDYLAKPFSITELIARVQALVRRASMTPEETVMRIGDLEMDMVAHKVTRAGRRIDLQPLEYQLLEYLMRNRGRVVSKTTIMERVWDYSFDPHTNVVECRVSRLRSKIQEKGEPELLHTVRGFGYVLEAR
ncbi:MAG: response regulator [Kiritimatiellia bacterium]